MNDFMFLVEIRLHPLFSFHLKIISIIDSTYLLHSFAINFLFRRLQDHAHEWGQENNVVSTHEFELSHHFWFISLQQPCSSNLHEEMIASHWFGHDDVSVLWHFFVTSQYS